MPWFRFDGPGSAWFRFDGPVNIGIFPAAAGGGGAVFLFIIGLLAIMDTPSAETKLSERSGQQAAIITSVHRLRAEPSFSCEGALTFGRQMICESADLRAIESYIEIVSTRQRDPSGSEHAALMAFIDQCQTSQCVINGGLEARLRQFDRENTMPDPRSIDAAS